MTHVSGACMAMLLARGTCRNHQRPRPAAQASRVLQPQAAPGGTRQPRKPAAGAEIRPTNDSAMSGGVHVQRQSTQDMQAAVSSKTFKCTQCGKCCSFLDDAEVWVSPGEVSRMAGHLGVSDDAFMASFTQPTDLSGWRMLEAKQAGPVSALTGDVCVFLDPLSLQCTIHTVRPLQCSTFPWWPELMHPRVWQDVKENLCEGLDHAEAGPLDMADAAEQLQAATEHVLQLDAVMPQGWADSHYEDEPTAADPPGQV